MTFDEFETCRGCGYCLSGKYIHPLGAKWAIKKIPGATEAWIISGAIIGGLILVFGIALAAQILLG